MFKLLPLTSTINIEKFKKCFNCKEIKAVTEFHKRNLTSYCSQCKKCISEHRKSLWAKNNKPILVPDLPGEEWKLIEFFKAKLYAVSNLGRIKSLVTDRHRCEHLKKPLKAKKDRVPYVALLNTRTGRSLNKTVHKIVATAFVPNPENKPEVRFNDGNVLNLNSNNLAWGTRTEHIRYGREVLGKKYQQSENHSSAKITNQDALFIFSYKGKSKELSKIYPQLKIDTIRKIRNGSIWGSVTNTTPIPTYREWNKELMFEIVNFKGNALEFCRNKGIPYGTFKDIRSGRTCSNITGIKFIKPS